MVEEKKKWWHQSSSRWSTHTATNYTQQDYVRTILKALHEPERQVYDRRFVVKGLHEPERQVYDRRFVVAVQLTQRGKKKG